MKCKDRLPRREEATATVLVAPSWLYHGW